MNEQFPIGGPRRAVYEALQSRGFTMSTWSDKHWDRADGLHAGVYGTGSMLQITRDGKCLVDANMAEALEWLDSQAARHPKPRGNE